MDGVQLIDCWMDGAEYVVHFSPALKYTPRQQTSQPAILCIVHEARQNSSAVYLCSTCFLDDGSVEVNLLQDLGSSLLYQLLG